MILGMKVSYETMFFVAVIVVVVGGALIQYRVGLSNGTRVGEYLNNRVAMAATHCSLGGNSFPEVKNGHIYVKGLQMRADWEEYKHHKLHRTIHAISLDGQTVYAWNDQNKVALTATMPEFLFEFLGVDTTDIFGCRPWIPSDVSLFTVPSTTFTVYVTPHEQK